ncbi:MAG TPA: SpoIID/LytB domain-containing protein, partial [Gaiellaceae bacterium]|nr:SpoIID/LytB domain-containing protein [Gaiellaceae bacterium]
MRVLSALVVLAALAAPGARGQPGPDAVAGEAVFLISGRGFGHGVGMSQWGAYGQALEGRSYREILAYYYPGTELARVPGREVRVLLAEGRRAVTITSTAPLTVVDATGASYRVEKGPLILRPDMVLPTEGGPAPAVPPLLVRPGKGGLLALDGRPYRGKLQVQPQGSLLRVINVVPLESYLLGVVAGEVPHRWPEEALKAQAVAARSYALAGLIMGKPFDLYADVRSQVYLGVEGERARTTAAVQATAREVLLYGGRVATTYYFSTSGGRTASAADVFGFSAPYLVSRPDPWDRSSPYHAWGPVLIGARTLQAKLELDARVLDLVGVPTPSGRLRSLVVTTVDGTEALPAALLRTALGLRSTWATIGVLRLDRPRAPVLFGSSLRLGGLARAVEAPTLASSEDGVSWSPVGRPERAADGSVSLTVAPRGPLRYRIEAEGAASPAVLVRVAPRVRLARDGQGALTGRVRPALPGAAVVL